MNKKQTLICALTALLLSAGTLRAQDNGGDITLGRSELGVALYAPSLASMPFDGSADWKDQLGASYAFGASYTYWFNQHVGVTSGLRFSILEHNQEVTAANMTFNGSQNVAGYGVTTVTMLADDALVHEEQNFNFLEIPVMLALKKNNAYLNLGASLAIAVSQNANYWYEFTAYNITGVPALGITMPTPVPVELKGSIDDKHTKPMHVDNPVYCLLDLEAGYKFDIDERNACSIGLFGRYGLNKRKAGSDDAPLSMRNSTISAIQPAFSNMVDKMGYYELGVRVSWHYKLGKK